MFRLVKLDKGGARAAVCFALLLVGGIAAADGADKVPTDIGVAGGSLPADGVVQAVEVVPQLDKLPQLDIGRSASAADIAAWDIDIRYDGVGLPAGEMGVEDGGVVYDEKCAVCHGDFGQGEGRWPVLVGGFESLTNQGGSHRPEKTVGSYWPFVSTLYDYIRRAMPYNTPQTLSNEETYGLVAYILYLNDLVGDEFVANADTLKNFKMPNEVNFFPDPRPDVQNPLCMKDCIDESEMALIESITGVTPLAHLQAQETVSAAAESAPVAVAAPAVSAEDEGHYKQYCALCHDAGLAEAPKLDAPDDWKERLQNTDGLAGLIQSAIGGKGAMPPKGGAVQLSDEQIGELVKYMLVKSGVAVE